MMNPRKGKGLSNTVAITYGSRGLHQMKTHKMRLNKSASQLAKKKTADQKLLAGESHHAQHVHSRISASSFLPST